MNNLQPYHPNDLEIYMDYQAKRDAPPPVPYTPPQSEVQPYNATKAMGDLVKPLLILSSLAGGVYMVGVCAVAVGAAIMTTVAAYAVPIGGTVAAVVTLVLCFGSRSEPDGKEVAKNANGGQIINVTVNIAGESVNVSNNGK